MATLNSVRWLIAGSTTKGADAAQGVPSVQESSTRSRPAGASPGMTIWRSSTTSWRTAVEPTSLASKKMFTVAQCDGKSVSRSVTDSPGVPADGRRRSGASMVKSDVALADVAPLLLTV